MTDPSSRVAIIVGGGWHEPDGSIGGAICCELARRGLQVAIVDQDASSAHATAARIAETGDRAHVIVADVTTQEGCQHVFDNAIARLNRIDVLVNNIGIGVGGSVVDADEADWERAMSANVNSAVLMCKLGVPLLPRGGVIINISSIAAFTPAEHATYTVSKAAIEGLTRVVAYHHGPSGIRANAVRVGEVATWRVLDGLDESEAAEVRKRRRERSVLGTQGDCWDIARAVAFLASDDARWITGQTLTVDGGASLKRGERWLEDRS